MTASSTAVLIASGSLPSAMLITIWSHTFSIRPDDRPSQYAYPVSANRSSAAAGNLSGNAEKDGCATAAAGIAIMAAILAT